MRSWFENRFQTHNNAIPVAAAQDFLVGLIVRQLGNLALQHVLDEFLGRTVSGRHGRLGHLCRQFLVQLDSHWMELGYRAS
jgi:hypothetical protein